MDLTQLQLEITNTEVVDKISERYGGATLSAKKGYRLVVVTLKGMVNQPCRIAYDPEAFTIIFEGETTRVGDTTETPLRFRKSAAAARDDSWAIPPEDASVVVTDYIYEAGPITLKVAAVLPENVTSLYVLFPALAKGKAITPK